MNWLKYGGTFFAGVFSMWLWHSASINRIDANQSKQEAVVANEQKSEAVKDGKDAAQNSGEYIEKLKVANTEINRLRAGLSDGSIKLRITESELATARVQAYNSAAIAEEARADYAAYRERVISLMEKSKDLDAWSESCWEWVNRK